MNAAPQGEMSQIWFIDLRHKRRRPKVLDTPRTV
jgi:hypothetical protein